MLASLARLFVRRGLTSHTHRNFTSAIRHSAIGVSSPTLQTVAIQHSAIGVSSPTLQTVMASKEESATAVSDNIVIIDNPCWGSPQQCSLSDLLSSIQKSKAILYETDDFLVLDKPPDLRMDGEYPATVHKLLTYWYPPPSLQRIKHELQSDNDEMWLSQIARYHKHSDHPDNELRPCQ